MTNFKTTAMAATALCALLSACETPAPLYPVTPAPVPAPPPAPPPPPPPPQDNSPVAAPSKPVAATPLPPPVGAQQAVAPSAKAEPAYTPPPPPPPPRMVAQKAPGSGKVHTDTPEPITVKKGDTLVGISHRTKIYVADLADLNDLEKPYRLKLGSKIKLPTKRYYEVESGDTLYSIARRFGLEAKALAEFNKFEPSKGVRSGQKIYLPADAKDKGAPKPIMVAVPVARPAAAPAPAPAAPSSPVGQGFVRPPPPDKASALPAAPQPYTAPPYTPPPTRPAQAAPAPPAQVAPPAPKPVTPPPAPLAKPAPAPAPAAPPEAAPTGALGDSEVAAAGRGLFQWPVRGELINTFGQRGAVRSDGVDIGATQGDSVRSAAAGEVVYAGNAVQGFGNLVLIKHAGGWVTAYAHLASIEVKMRQAVTQGQEIGLVGQTGGVDRPQLHFEIRYAPTTKDKARPVDPMLVLPVQ